MVGLIGQSDSVRKLSEYWARIFFLKQVKHHYSFDLQFAPFWEHKWELTLSGKILESTLVLARGKIYLNIRLI